MSSEQPQAATPVASPVDTSAEALRVSAPPQSNLVLGTVAGIVAAIAGAVGWAVITYVTEMKIGYVAIGVGFLVGLAVRKFGKGSTPVYGVIGAVLALAGCLGGDLLSLAAFAAKESDASLLTVLTHLPPEAFSIVIENTSPIGWLINVFAVMAGYKYSIVGQDQS